METKHSTVREPVYDFLDPSKIRLFTDGSGRVRLVVKDDRRFPEVKVVRAFPLSSPDGYLGFLDGKDKIIELVKNPSRDGQGIQRTGQGEA